MKWLEVSTLSKIKKMKAKKTCFDSIIKEFDEIFKEIPSGSIVHSLKYQFRNCVNDYIDNVLNQYRVKLAEIRGE